MTTTPPIIGLGTPIVVGNVNGDKDAVVPTTAVAQLVEKLKTQKGIVIEQQILRGANHFFDGKIEPLMEIVGEYLDKRLPKQRDSAA